MDGVPGREVKDEFIAIGHRRDVLEAQVKGANEPPPLLHPSMAELYRTKVNNSRKRSSARTPARKPLTCSVD
jgi:hypothetical protein